MTAITINIPNHEVSFFKKMIAKMGWTYSETDVVRSAATPHEQASISNRELRKLMKKNGLE